MSKNKTFQFLYWPYLHQIKLQFWNQLNFSCKTVLWIWNGEAFARCTLSMVAEPVLTSSTWWKVFFGTRCWRTFQWNVAIESEWETQTIKWGDKVDVEDLKLWKRFIHILNPCKYLEQNNSIYVLFLQLARPVPSFPAQIRQPFSHLCLQSSSVSPVLQNLQPA